MKCQILFSGKNKKNILNLPSAENAQRVVKVKVRSSVMQTIQYSNLLETDPASTMLRSILDHYQPNRNHVELIMAQYRYPVGPQRSDIA